MANMRHGDVDCAGCGESWSSKPSRIYLLSFTLPDLPVIKLGFSSNPSFRLRQVQRDPGQTKGKLLRAIPIASGHRAICIEKALHAHIKAHRPDLIVPAAITWPMWRERRISSRRHRPEPPQIGQDLSRTAENGQSLTRKALAPSSDRDVLRQQHVVFQQNKPLPDLRHPS